MLRIALLLALLLAPGAALAVPVTVSGPEGRVAWYEARVPVLANEVADALGAGRDAAIAVVLARTDGEFQREAGDPPGWAAAVALPRRGTLVVRLSSLGPSTATDASGLLRHEIVHLLLPRRIGWDARVPRWFEEGLAQVLGGRIFRVDEETLPLTAAAGRLIPLAGLETSFPDDPTGAALAYAEGESVLRFLLERGGREALARLLDGIRDQGSFDAAFERVYGLSRRELEAAWREWIDTEGSPWWEVVLSVATIPFLLFVASLLVFAAFLRARRRGRRIYESLPE